mgnify:CR=1 FL=1
MKLQVKPFIISTFIFYLDDEKELVIEFNDHSQDVDLDEVYQKIVK